MGLFPDIRWEQRFMNYQKALVKLTIAVQIIKDKQLRYGAVSTDIDDLQKEGLIQRFEYTQELAWKVMKDFGEYQGYDDIKGSRDAIRLAFKMHLIVNPEYWMDMLVSRNATSHTYNNEIADEIIRKILDEYYNCFLLFEDRMKEIQSENLNNIEQ